MSMESAARIVLIASVFSGLVSEPANAFPGSSAYNSPKTIEKLSRKAQEVQEGKRDEKPPRDSASLMT